MCLVSLLAGGAPNVQVITAEGYLSGVHGCVMAVSLGNTGNLSPFHLDSSFAGAGVELCSEA